MGQGLFLLLFLLRHLAAVAHGDSVLIVVFSYHEPVFELDVDGFAEVSDCHFGLPTSTFSVIRVGEEGRKPMAKTLTLQDVWGWLFRQTLLSLSADCHLGWKVRR